MNEKDDDIADPGMLSNPNTLDFAATQQFAMRTDAAAHSSFHIARGGERDQQPKNKRVIDRVKTHGRQMSPIDTN
jgi:hypothetical protein